MARTSSPLWPSSAAPTQVRQSYIPVFKAGFAAAEIVDTCGKLDDPDAPGLVP